MPRALRKKTKTRRDPRLASTIKNRKKSDKTKIGTIFVPTSSSIALVSPSPWKTGWFHPVQTIRMVLKSDPKLGSGIIAFPFGLTQIISAAESRHWGDNIDLAVLVLIFLVVAWGLGYISIHVQGWFFKVVGSLLGGQGTREQTDAVVVWGNVTILLNPFVDMLLIAGAGAIPFKTVVPGSMGLWAALVIFLVGLFHLFRVLWSAILIVGGLAEVHRFSRWKALATVIICYTIQGLIFFLPRLLKN